MDITFRPAVIEDAASISTLILATQKEYCFHEYTEEGIALMFQLCGAQAIVGYLERGDTYFVAEHDGTIVGVAGIRDIEHPSHNFVSTRWHRKGISKKLWHLVSTVCRKKGNPGIFNLNSSTYAIPVYESWGFVQTGPTVQTHGITSTPMEAADA